MHTPGPSYLYLARRAVRRGHHTVYGDAGADHESLSGYVTERLSSVATHGVSVSPASPVTSTSRKQPWLPYLLCLYRTLFRTDEAVAQESLWGPALRHLEAFIKHLPEAEPEGGDPAATEATVAGSKALASISMALFCVRAEFWWPAQALMTDRETTPSIPARLYEHFSPSI